MIVKLHKRFRKHYKLRILPNKTLDKRFDERYDLFVENPANPVLNDHPLTGKFKGYRAFSITGDIRVIYKIETSAIRFYDVGTHNQVYR